MGTCKDRTRFPKYVCDFIHVNLIKVYCNVYPDFNVGFTTQLMDIFGNDYAGIDLSIYSRLAKLLDKSKLLNLDEVVNDDVLKAYQQLQDTKVPGMFNKSEQGKKSTNELLSKLGGFRGLRRKG